MGHSTRKQAVEFYSAANGKRLPKSEASNETQYFVSFKSFTGIYQISPMWAALMSFL